MLVSYHFYPWARDFSVVFDQCKAWTTFWKWIICQTPKELRNRMLKYAITRRNCNYAEIMDDLWYPDKLNPLKSLILLMTVVWGNKQKVCLVLNFRELNGFADVFSANVEVCAQKLREWQGANMFLQIHIDKALWTFQTVLFKRYSLSQLGFDHKMMPLIMKSIIDLVVSQNKKGFLRLRWHPISHAKSLKEIIIYCIPTGLINSQNLLTSLLVT